MATMKHGTSGSRRSASESEQATSAAPFGHSARGIDGVLFDLMIGLRHGSLISTGTIVKEVRQRLPQLEIDDDRLANIIADHAVGMGLSVTFDSRES